MTTTNIDKRSENYIRLANGLQLGSGYDVEVLRMRGDNVLVCWTEVNSKRSGITEASLEGRTLEAVARDAGAGAIGDWGITWDDDENYDQLADRWDARRAVVDAEAD